MCMRVCTVLTHNNDVDVDNATTFNFNQDEKSIPTNECRSHIHKRHNIFIVRFDVHFDLLNSLLSNEHTIHTIQYERTNELNE